MREVKLDVKANHPSPSGRPPRFRSPHQFALANNISGVGRDRSNTTVTAKHIMSVRQAPTYQQGAPERALDDDSDVEEEALANDYREQVGYEDGDDYDLDRNMPTAGGLQDLQAQLQAAATPLEYQATLETKIQSYDSYCALFHFILNSEGPVDLEMPSVCRCRAVRTSTNIG